MDVLIEKHEFSNLIHKPEHTDFVAFVLEAVDIIHVVDELKNTMLQGLDKSIDNFDELDILEMSVIDNFATINKCANGVYSVISPVNTCIQNICINIQNLNTLINHLLELGIFPDDDYRKRVISLCNYINGALLYVLWYDYKVFQTAYAIESGSSSVIVDEALKTYCNANFLDLDSFILELVQLHDKYHFVLSVFEDCPELEEQFINIVGPLLGAVHESDLTIKDVKDVCEGILTPEDLINKQAELEPMDEF